MIIPTLLSLLKQRNTGKGVFVAKKIPIPRERDGVLREVRISVLLSKGKERIAKSSP
jgi:hypothetical protein